MLYTCIPVHICNVIFSFLCCRMQNFLIPNEDILYSANCYLLSLLLLFLILLHFLCLQLCLLPSPSVLYSLLFCSYSIFRPLLFLIISTTISYPKLLRLPDDYFCYSTFILLLFYARCCALLYSCCCYFLFLLLLFFILLLLFLVFP